ncbi:MAG TPA: toll/interleukin-1 receptor domain-containing protein [Thermoanaerobaculia bacterium]|nr:toll/interleukin-1 receptor domain-containing protein [Thermoanaerobaculia bacterium]
MASEKSSNSLQVFISYSHNDAVWAKSFAEALSKRGVDVWFDQFRVQPGESLRDALEDGLRSSDIVVTLIDSTSPSQPNLFFELGAAIGMGKRVVAIVPRGLSAAQLPPEIRLRRYLTRDSPEETAEELSHALTAA